MTPTAPSAGKPIEFTIPCHKLCEFEDVKNFTRLDGSRKTFIEKQAYLSLQKELSDASGEVERVIRLDNSILKERKEEIQSLKYQLQIAVEGLERLTEERVTCISSNPDFNCGMVATQILNELAKLREAAGR